MSFKVRHFCARHTVKVWKNVHFVMDTKVILYCKYRYLQWQLMCVHREWIESVACHFFQIIDFLNVQCVAQVDQPSLRKK